jgi:hypothetical protein
LLVAAVAAVSKPTVEMRVFRAVARALTTAADVPEAAAEAGRSQRVVLAASGTSGYQQEQWVRLAMAAVGRPKVAEVAAATTAAAAEAQQLVREVAHP